jgi:uncharacterized membrane protein
MEAPDEIVHFVKAYAAAEGKFIPAVREGIDDPQDMNDYGYYLPAGVWEIFDALDDIRLNPKSKFADWKTALDSLHDSRELTFTMSVGATSYSPVSYIPQTIGIKIGQIFGSSILGQYYLAKLFNLLIYSVLCMIAIKKWGGARSKYAAYILILNPMALFLAASTSWDAIAIAGSFLFTSLILQLTQKRAVLYRDLVAPGIILTLLVQMKPNLFLLGLLFFAISNKSLPIKKKMLAGIIIAALPIAIYIGWSFFVPSSQIIYAGHGDPAAQLSYLLHNPLSFLKTLILDYVIYTGFDDMLRSMVGFFGWWDTPMALWVILFYFILLAIGILHLFGRSYDFKLSRCAIFAATAVLYTLSCFLVLYLIWSEPGGKIIGLQGRYFIPIGFVFVSVFCGKDIVLQIRDRVMRGITFGGIAIVLGMSYMTLILRYWI